MNTAKEMFRRPFTPYGISLIGIMSAMAITVTRLLTFVTPVQRFDPGGPAIIMLSGMILGPVGGALVGGLSDLLGFFFWNPTSYPWNPLIFIGQIMYGFIAGLLMMKRFDKTKFKKYSQIAITVLISQLSGFIFICWGLMALLELPFTTIVIMKIGFQPYFIGWYAIVCMLVLPPIEKIFPWSRKVESYS